MKAAIKINGVVQGTLIISLVIFSCHKKDKTQQEIAKFVSDPANRLEVVQRTGEIETSAAFRPTQLIIGSLKEKKRELDLKNKYFFVLSLSAHHKELLRQLSFDSYSEMVQVLAFRMSEYVSAVTDDGHTVQPAECLFDQTYGMSNANHLLIVFNKSNFEGAKQIFLKIKEFGLNTGNLSYQFDKQNMDNL
jgi:hypothetical protein